MLLSLGFQACFWYFLQCEAKVFNATQMMATEVNLQPRQQFTCVFEYKEFSISLQEEDAMAIWAP